jgi:hypothetical protein
VSCFCAVTDDEIEVDLKVTGMVCSVCAGSVTTVLEVRRCQVFIGLFFEYEILIPCSCGVSIHVRGTSEP